MRERVDKMGGEEETERKEELERIDGNGERVRWKSWKVVGVGVGNGVKGKGGGGAIPQTLQ